MSTVPFSYKDTSHLGYRANQSPVCLHLNLIRFAETLFSNKVTFMGTVSIFGGYNSTYNTQIVQAKERGWVSVWRPGLTEGRGGSLPGGQSMNSQLQPEHSCLSFWILSKRPKALGAVRSDSIVGSEVGGPVCGHGSGRPVVCGEVSGLLLFLLNFWTWFSDFPFISTTDLTSFHQIPSPLFKLSKVNSCLQARTLSNGVIRLNWFVSKYYQKVPRGSRTQAQLASRE